MGGPMVYDAVAGIVTNSEAFHEEVISRALDGVAEFIFTIQNRALAIDLNSYKANAGFINHDGLMIEARGNFDAAAGLCCVNRRLNGLARFHFGSSRREKALI